MNANIKRIYEERQPTTNELIIDIFEILERMDRKLDANGARLDRIEQGGDSRD
ncbi:MAG TPA: hypothetical protein VFK27_02975 [Bacillales bacterium]|nr:hypothetical protein [Bacillales bacterium]